MDKILLFHGQKFAKSEFSRHIQYNFLKEVHKNNFHIKSQEDSQRRLEVKGQKPSNCQFWPEMTNFWPQMAKLWPSQNFPGIYTMIFSKKTTRVVSIPKIMKIYSGVWKIQAKNTQKWLFWPKRQNFGHFGGQKMMLNLY